MKKKLTTIIDDIALSRLQVQTSTEAGKRIPGDWIRILRNRLRMTQTELAKRAHITQPNLAAIESGKVDPQVGTLRRIYKGLWCDLNIEPRLQKPLHYGIGKRLCAGRPGPGGGSSDGFASIEKKSFSMPFAAAPDGAAVPKPAVLHIIPPILPRPASDRTELAITNVAPIKLTRVQRRRPRPVAVPAPK